MTRASLLHILDHVSGISDTEVRELEQLAAAFPYCQTAHVLLAKAAHDRGSMLAGQRLRRAATYAADRELLRQLLDQPVAPVAVQAANETTVVAAPTPTLASAATGAVTAAIPAFFEQETAVIAPAAPLTPAVLPELSVSPAFAAEAPEAEPLADEPVQTPEPVAAPLEPEERPAAPEVVVPQATEAVLTEPATLDDVLPTAAEVAEETATASAPASLAAAEAVAVEEQPDNDSPAELLAVIVPVSAEPQELPATSPGEASATALPDAGATDAEAAATELPGNANVTLVDADLLPAVAPPIRPPVEAGISRFEFGLSEPELPVPSGYQLPELEEDDDDELPTLGNLSAKPAPAVTEPFRTDKDLGYSLGAGSRLGYDLQPHDGYTLDLPLDAFFEPDALLLAHMRTHQPKPTASSLDLINQFLKAKPRIKSPAGVPPPAAEQADLSVRSLTAAPALASESLAKIMVRQGKKDKAIEIYERLMERQPEKKAYFADQIQQLQQPSE